MNYHTKKAGYYIKYDISNIPIKYPPRTQELIVVTATKLYHWYNIGSV